MDRDLAAFVKLFVVVVAIFLLVAMVLAVLLHQALLWMLVEVYFWIGIAYIGASTLAWSGVANMYRYSPTLFVGSRSYRQQILRSQMWKEGRDDRSFLLGLGFGGALLGLAAALYDPLFILPDVVVVGAVLSLLRLLKTRVVAHA